MTPFIPISTPNERRRAMMLRGLASFFLPVWIAMSIPGSYGVHAQETQEAPASPPTDRPDPTHFILLESGPGDPTATAEDRAAMQQAHLANLTRLYLAGKSPLAGPLGQESRAIRGIVVLALPDSTDVQHEFAEDPYVAGDFLRVRAHRWNCRVGSFRVPDGDFALGEYVLAIVRPGDAAASRQEATRAYTALERILARNVPATTDGTPGSKRTLGIAGPISPPKDAGTSKTDAPVGIMIFREPDIQKVRFLVREADTSPEGTLKVDLFRQYLGKGIIDGAPNG